MEPPTALVGAVAHRPCDEHAQQRANGHPEGVQNGGNLHIFLHIHRMTRKIPINIK